jgi:hypothetical protein
VNVEPVDLRIALARGIAEPHHRDHAAVTLGGERRPRVAPDPRDAFVARERARSIHVVGEDAAVGEAPARDHDVREVRRIIVRGVADQHRRMFAR